MQIYYYYTLALEIGISSALIIDYLISSLTSNFTLLKKKSLNLINDI